MATARSIITRAMRKLKILAGGEDPTSDEADDCLDALNQMLSEWRIDGIDLAHVDLVLTDEVDVPASHRNAIVLNLALRIADDFGAQITPSLANEASNGRAALVAYHFTIGEIGIDHPSAQPRSGTDL
jgi:hypothetical protein